MWLDTDVLGLSISATFEGQAVQEETSISNRLTPRNIPEDGRILWNRDGSLTMRTDSSGCEYVLMTQF